MLRKIIHYIARRRHPWREMEFDELAEIYTSMSLRSFGFSVIGIFVPVYLYTSGVSLQGVLLFLTMFFAFRVPFSLVAAYIVGRIGPKHTIAVSTIIAVVFLVMLLSYDSIGWPLIVLAFVFNFSNNIFFVAYNTDFSKIKDQKNGGKELGWLYIFERAGNTLGPIVGGALGSYWAPEATLIFAIVVLIASLVPLFLTNEPVKVHQKIDFRGFRPSEYTRDFVSVSAFGVQNVVVAWLWPLLAAVFIFTDDTYAKVGGIVGLTMGISIFSARMFGKFIDGNKGLSLLKYGVGMSFVLSFAKALTTTAGGAVVVSSLGEPIALSYRMPLTKGLYDAADAAKGHRIVYFAWSEMYSGGFKFLFCGGLLVAMHAIDPISALRLGFVVAPFIGLLMLSQKFPALKN